MSNQKGQKQQNQCIKCKQQIPQEMIICTACQDLGPQAFSENQETLEQRTRYSNDVAREDQLQGAASKHKSKRKKKKKKRRQGPESFTEQKSNGNESMKGAQFEKKLNIKREDDGDSIKVDVAVKTGESFGKGWWNPSATIKKAEVGEPFIQNAARSEATSSKTRLKFKDFYSDSEDEEEEIKGKLKEMPKADMSSAPESAAMPVKDSAPESAAVPVKDSAPESAAVPVKDSAPESAAVPVKDSAPESAAVPVKDKLKKMPKADKSSVPVSASAPSSGASLEAALSALKIEKNDDAKKSKAEGKETKGSATRGRCSYCKKEGFVLKCSRCQLSSYCNRQCQKSDYPQHKVICRRKEMFNLVLSKIPVILKLSLVREHGRFEVSPFLADLPGEFEYALGARGTVVAEIIGPYFHIFRYGICIRDVAGEETHIVFYSETNVYVHVTDRGAMPVPLGMCLKPGNFILLLDTHWHGFLDGTVGIRIDSLNEVYFILEK